MNIKSWCFVTLSVAVFAFVSVNAAAESDDVTIKWSTGYNYTSGDYGGLDDIEDTYIPVTVAVNSGRYGFRLTVPYLSVRAPTGTLFDPGGQPIPGTGGLRTESGLGDIIASATLYDVINNHDFAVDLTAKVKFGTADETKGLGTGEQDYTVQADIYKFFNQFSLLGTAGYKVRGDPSGIDLENVMLASLGGIYKFTPDTRAGLIYDYRESSFIDGESLRELTGFVSQSVSDRWRVQLYALTGFSDSSPDWGAGVLLKKTL